MAINAQLKVSIHPQGGKKQPCDFPRVVNILKKNNYRGYVVLEFEENVPDPKAEIAKHIEQLRKLVRA